MTTFVGIVWQDGIKEFLKIYWHYSFPVHKESKNDKLQQSSLEPRAAVSVSKFSSCQSSYPLHHCVTTAPIVIRNKFLIGLLEIIHKLVFTSNPSTIFLKSFEIFYNILNKFNIQFRFPKRHVFLPTNNNFPAHKEEEKLEKSSINFYLTLSPCWTNIEKNVIYGF